jgi:hypothetical protein
MRIDPIEQEAEETKNCEDFRPAGFPAIFGDLLVPAFIRDFIGCSADFRKMSIGGP